MSGIIQGCPGSGALFAVGSHPFLVDMWKRLEAQNDVPPGELREDLTGPARERQMSMARACADDIGSV
eukprot:7315103-Pyramimonas_sp.AAC.1